MYIIQLFRDIDDFFMEYEKQTLAETLETRDVCLFLFMLQLLTPSSRY